MFTFLILLSISTHQEFEELLLKHQRTHIGLGVIEPGNEAKPLLLWGLWSYTGEDITETKKKTAHSEKSQE